MVIARRHNSGKTRKLPLMIDIPQPKPCRCPSGKMVRERGLEPPPLTGPDPKSGVSAISPLAHPVAAAIVAANRARSNQQTECPLVKSEAPSSTQVGEGSDFNRSKRR